MSVSSDAPPNLESTNPDFFSRHLLGLAQNRFLFKNQNRQNVNIETFIFYQDNFQLFEIDRLRIGRFRICCSI